jgi:hypothetical protein
MLSAQGHRAERDLYRATPAVTRRLRFPVLYEGPPPFNRLLRLARGCGEPILTRNLTGLVKFEADCYTYSYFYIYYVWMKE